MRITPPSLESWCVEGEGGVTITVCWRAVEEGLVKTEVLESHDPFLTSAVKMEA
jgi:hypothetical protein